jgi:GTP-binding protein
VLRAAFDRQQPSVVRGRRPKLFYGTQAGVAPPTFVFFANEAAAIHFSYRRYLENQLREAFGFDGTPIRLVFRDRESARLPRRRSTRGSKMTGKTSAAKSTARRASTGGRSKGR